MSEVTWKHHPKALGLGPEGRSKHLTVCLLAQGVWGVRYCLEGGVCVILWREVCASFFGGRCVRCSLEGEWVHYSIALQRCMGSVVPWTEGEVSGEGRERAGVLYIRMDLRPYE